MPVNIVQVCVLMIPLAQGNVCIKPDGNVKLPKDMAVTEAARQFWQQLGYQYPTVIENACDPHGAFSPKANE